MKRVAIVFAGLTRSSLLSHEREPLRVCPSMNLAAGVSTKKLYRNAHLTLERAPSLSVADMNATMTAWRGLRVAERAAAVGVSADTIRYYERTGLLLAPARTPSGYRAYEASRKTRPDNCPVKVPLTHLHVCPRWSGPQSRETASGGPARAAPLEYWSGGSATDHRNPSRAY
jgi:hypothetical protein